MIKTAVVRARDAIAALPSRHTIGPVHRHVQSVGRVDHGTRDAGALCARRLAPSRFIRDHALVAIACVPQHVDGNIRVIDQPLRMTQHLTPRDRARRRQQSPVQPCGAPAGQRDSVYLGRASCCGASDSTRTSPTFTLLSDRSRVSGTRVMQTRNRIILAPPRSTEQPVELSLRVLTIFMAIA